MNRDPNPQLSQPPAPGELGNDQETDEKLLTLAQELELWITGWWVAEFKPAPMAGSIRRLAESTAELVTEREKRREATLATFHTDPEHGQYDCIGYSEGQECCVEKLHALLAEPVGREEPSLGEIQRRGYRYGPGESIPGDAVDTAKDWE